eukprot:5488212-Alexandrium_andersonii.AAC.1
MLSESRAQSAWSMCSAISVKASKAPVIPEAPNKLAGSECLPRSATSHAAALATTSGIARPVIPCA